jgi:hypothetical protein
MCPPTKFPLFTDYDSRSSSDARRFWWSPIACVNHPGARPDSPTQSGRERFRWPQYPAESSSDEHLVPNKVKADEARHFSGGSIFKMTVDSVLNNLSKLFNILCLSHNRMPKACGHESTIYFVFTYFKDDFLHGSECWQRLRVSANGHGLVLFSEFLRRCVAPQILTPSLPATFMDRSSRAAPATSPRLHPTAREGLDWALSLRQKHASARQAAVVRGGASRKGAVEETRQNPRPPRSHAHP